MSDEQVKKVMLMMLEATKGAVDIMGAEAQLHEEFSTMPASYRAGWLDAMNLVSEVMVGVATKVREM